MEIESIIAATIGFFGMSWIIIELLKLTKSVGRMEVRLNNIEERLDKLPCDSHQNTINKIQLDLLEHRTYLKTKFPTAKSIFSEKKSPAQLNDCGQKLFSDMNGEDFLMHNGAYFLQKMEEQHPKTAFDVENIASEVLLFASSEDRFNQIKNKVYHYPAIDILNRHGESVKYEVSLADVCFVLSLALRDKYLETHPQQIANN